MPSHQADHASGVVVLSAEQFDKIVELLTPVCELAKAVMAEKAAQDGAKPANDEPANQVQIVPQGQAQTG